MYKAKRAIPYLTGFENNFEDGTDDAFNFILSNGDRSNQRDVKYYDHLMPEGSHSKIRSVSIHHNTDHICGFSFFDKEGALLWKIGNTDSYLFVELLRKVGLIDSSYKRETVLIGENEVIIGVVAKL